MIEKTNLHAKISNDNAEIALSDGPLPLVASSAKSIIQ